MRKSNKILRLTNMLGLKCAFFFLVFMTVAQCALAWDFSAVAPSGQILYYSIISSQAVKVTYPRYHSSGDFYYGYTKPTGSLTIPSSVSYGSNTYSVTTIGDRSFHNCSGLTSVTIPNSVTTIEYHAFNNCSGMSSVTIPNSVTTIEFEAFNNCSGLTSVTIPNSVTTIGSNAFNHCTGLTTVNFNADSCNDVGSWNSCAFYGDTNISTINFGNSVTIIPAFLCHGLSGLSSVTIPNSVTTIGHDSFSGCSGLTSVTIPNSVNTIGYDAFRNCSVLISVTIGNSVTTIGPGVFYGCSGLISVTIPNSVTTIGSCAFYGCSGLSTITIPNSVTSIGSSAFENCTGLATVNFNADSCNSAGIHNSYNNPAFWGDTNISTINFGNNVTIIPAYLCYGLSGLSSVTIPNSVTTIGNAAFADCTGLTTVNYNADSCIYAGSSSYVAFSGDINISTINFGNNVTIIPANLCNGLSGLSSVTIPNSVTNIGNNAFRNCNGLTTVYFYADSCSGAGSSSSNRVFYGDTNISTIIFGNSVSIIPSCLCYGLSGLSSVIIPNSVITIGGGAFYDCSGLTSVTIGNSVTTIGNSAFYGCNGLTSVTIPNSVTAIGMAAFGGCTRLGAVWLLPNEPPSLGGNSTFPSNVNRFLVSCDAYDAYYSYFIYLIWPVTGFYSYASRLQIYDLPNFVINVSVNNPIFGTAAIVQQNNQDYSCDSLCIIIATSRYGYHFEHWSNGRTANPDTLHIMGDSMIMAYFAPNQYTLTLQSSDETLGTVSGSGEYGYNDTVTISATAIPHYHFVRWSDNNTDNPRQVVVVGDMTLTAYFSIDVYNVSVSVDSLIHGIVSGDGNFTYGTAATVSATPYSGWEFSHWSDGARYNPYTFAVLQDTVLIAYFVPEGSQNEVDGVGTIEARIYVANGQIVVEGAEGYPVYLYDVVGRLLATKRETAQEVLLDMPASGAYLVKIGDAPARRVVVW